MKVGDEVRIIKKFNKDMRKFVDPGMEKYCGKLATILDYFVDQHSKYYLLDIDNQHYTWIESLLEHAPAFTTLTIPEGYVLDRIENNKILIKRERLPKTWEECVKSLERTSYIDDYSNVKPAALCNDATESDHNLIPEGLGKPMLALTQLLICREVYRNGWKPDWNNTGVKYCIINIGNEPTIYDTQSGSHVLSFQSAKVRYEFLKNFRDLIEEAKELI